jgi:threonine/homoserine/homoserine lactone efflux protein
VLDIQHYPSFIAAIVLFQAIPGAGTIAILNATARHGTAAGLAAVAGTLCGDFAYMVAAVAGLAAIMNGHPLAFAALQWFGAGYLVWIGIGLLRARIDPDAAGAEAVRSRAWYFRQAFTVSLTNPKVILFFVSFFPLFLRADAAPATLVAMMLHVTVLSFLWQAGLVLAGNAVARRLRSVPSARRIATRLAGLALIAFGLRLAAGNR